VGQWHCSTICYAFPSQLRTQVIKDKAEPKNPRSLVGTSFIVWNEKDNVPIGCMVTSYNYGVNVDPPHMIVEATATAAAELIRLASMQGKEIHSPKINSGLFRVPWEQTEAVLIKALEKHPEINWTVWSI